MNEPGYRARIYQRYVHSRQTPLAPVSLDGLSSQAPYQRRMIRSHFPVDRDARILDLGCGHGVLVHFAREAGFRNVSGVDRSAEQVAEARRLGIDGVVQGDLMDTLRSLPDGSHQTIVAFDVIEHFTRDELLPLVDEVQRVLRAGGRWIIHTPNADSPFFGRIRYGDLTHEQAFTPTSIAQLLFASGFSDVDCFEDAPIAHGVRSLLRLVAWSAIRTALRFYLTAETGSSGSGIFSQNFLIVAVK
jgi:SAM-dependent methyltransferase